jgi:DnaJ-class molecular chaperone
MNKLFQNINVTNFLLYLYILFHIFTIISSFQISTNVTIEVDFDGDALLNIEKKFSWGEDIKEDINMDLTLTLLESFNGKNISISYDRLKVNDKCNTMICNRCGGKKYNIVETNYPHDIMSSKSRTTFISTPCPICFGSGIVTKGCNPFLKYTDTVNSFVPRGSHTGNIILSKGSGNEIYDLNKMHFDNEKPLKKTGI